MSSFERRQRNPAKHRPVNLSRNGLHPKQIYIHDYVYACKPHHIYLETSREEITKTKSSGPVLRRSSKEHQPACQTNLARCEGNAYSVLEKRKKANPVKLSHKNRTGAPIFHLLLAYTGHKPMGDLPSWDNSRGELSSIEHEKNRVLPITDY